MSRHQSYQYLSRVLNASRAIESRELSGDKSYAGACFSGASELDADMVIIRYQRAHVNISTCRLSYESEYCFDERP